jgi:hypothetical protein
MCLRIALLRVDKVWELGRVSLLIGSALEKGEEGEATRVSDVARCPRPRKGGRRRTRKKTGVLLSIKKKRKKEEGKRRRAECGQPTNKRPKDGGSRDDGHLALSSSQT